MRKIFLNGAEMVDHATTHAYLKSALNLPDHYGENLDALWDCLSTDRSEKKIIIHHPEMIRDHLGSYGESIIELFWEVADENECIQVEIVDESFGAAD